MLAPVMSASRVMALLAVLAALLAVPALAVAHGEVAGHARAARAGAMRLRRAVAAERRAAVARRLVPAPRRRLAARALGGACGALQADALTCHTTVRAVREAARPIAATRAPVPTLGAIVRTRICALAPTRFGCWVFTTALRWSPDPDGGAVVTRLECTPGPVAACAPLAPASSVALACGPLALACVRVVSCQIAADGSGAACALALDASYRDRPPAAKVSYVPKPSVRLTCPCGVEGIPIPFSGPGPKSRYTPPPSIRSSSAPAPSAVALPVSLVSTATRTVPSTPSLHTLITATSTTPNAVSGQPVVLSALITPVPSGATLQFLAGGAPIPGCRAIKITAVTGAAACRARFALPGTYDVQVLFSGQGSFAASRSTLLRVVVHSSLTLSGRPVASGTTVRTRLICARASGGCAVTAALVLPGSRPATLGETSTRIAAGKTVTLEVTLSPTGQARLAQTTHLAAEQTIALTAAGHSVTVATSPLTLSR